MLGSQLMRDTTDFITVFITDYMGFPGGSAVKSLLAVQETRVRSLGGEGSLEEGMATHSSILAWRIPWTEEPAGCSS